MSKNKSFVRNENNMLFGIIGDKEKVFGIFSFFNNKERYRGYINITGEEETVTGIFSFFRDIGIILIL